MDRGAGIGVDEAAPMHPPERGRQRGAKRQRPRLAGAAIADRDAGDADPAGLVDHLIDIVAVDRSRGPVRPALRQSARYRLQAIGVESERARRLLPAPRPDLGVLL